MSWEPEVNEIALRRQFALQMGGPERVKRQHDSGKLTIRERIHALVDPGTFEEIGGLAGVGTYTDGQITGFLPAPFVGGVAKVDGRQVAVGGEDFTVRGGSASMPMERSKGTFLERLAHEWRLPLFLFLDGAGANVEAVGDLGHTYLPSSHNVFAPMVEAGVEVPVMGAVVGSIAGAVAARAMLCHFTVMSEPAGALFAAGPPVVKRAIGAVVTKAELGGVKVHVQTSGAVDNAALDENDVIKQLKKFFSYLPSTVHELPTVLPCDDPPDRREESLLTLVPRTRTRPYNMRKVIEAVCDNGDYFEIQPQYGTSVIVVLTRINGMPVGLIANNPMMMGGALTAGASDKQGHFSELCDHFHIPIVYLADVPGFMIGPQAEQAGTLRHGMRAFWASINMTVPVLTVVTRKNYGMAGHITGRANKLNYRLGWPSGEWGSIPIEGGVDAAFRREIETAEDPAKRRAEIEARLQQFRSVFGTAEAFGVEDLIDPRDTRRYIAKWLEIAYRQLPLELGIK
ncbi:MAG: acyl-CoA carboxylase subunit beta, partial [Dehalococcoidia bacterium]